MAYFDQLNSVVEWVVDSVVDSVWQFGYLPAAGRRSTIFLECVASSTAPATAAGTAAFFTTFAANLSKIMLSGLFEDKPVYRKFLILVFVILLSTIIFSLIGGLWVNYVYGIDMLQDPNALADLENPAVLSAMKILQILTTGIGMFLIPSFIAAILFSKEPVHYLSMKNPPSNISF
ncbi:MAG TPA: hypothetical protein PKD91_05730, partial [Bacteroidia bacterium]|nr:hypothetical protein [Bacteroidia bacterium]